jgi:hypothetical protein
MSRTPFAPLFDRLVDDAAVFPPGNAALEVAVREHLDRRATGPGVHVGPLLVPAASARRLAALAAADDRTTRDPLAVSLVVRPSEPLEALTEAVALLRDDARVLVVAGEVGWTESWRELVALGVPLVVEVGIGGAQERALDEVAVAVDEDHDVRAKFRTGPTPTWPWPDEDRLGGFLDAVVLRGLSFKLTGGLHHAVRGRYADEPMHGLLNVLLAVHEALDGAEAPHLAATLARTDTEVIAGAVASLDEAASTRVRRAFTSYGCCGVLDPLRELDALGLLR